MLLMATGNTMKLLRNKAGDEEVDAAITIRLLTQMRSGSFFPVYVMVFYESRVGSVVDNE